MKTGERQVAEDLSGIRADHRSRYEWAARRLPEGSYVLDAGCGVGYGAYILGIAGHRVVAVDQNDEAIKYAKRYYPHTNIRHDVVDLTAIFERADQFDAVVCFEVIEHVVDGGALLENLAFAAPRLLGSVPNESTLKYNPERFPFHFRHYTPTQIRHTLDAAGWSISAVGRQRNAIEAVSAFPLAQFGDMLGRTIVFDADRKEPQ